MIIEISTNEVNSILCQCPSSEQYSRVETASEEISPGKFYKKINNSPGCGLGICIMIFRSLKNYIINCNTCSSWKMLCWPWLPWSSKDTSFTAKKSPSLHQKNEQSCQGPNKYCSIFLSDPYQTQKKPSWAFYVNGMQW